MSEDRERELDRLFGALADRTRRRILEMSASKAVAVGELVDEFDISAPAITRHLGVLEAAGLLERTKHGRMRICRAKISALEPISDALTRYRAYWTASLDNLEDFLDELQDANTKD